MDHDYDLQAAGMQLELLARERHDSPHSELQLSRVHSLSARYEPVVAGTSRKLAHKGLNEEVVGYFQGVIQKLDLPPFTQKLGKNSGHVKHLRQSVSITGLGTKTFKDVLSVVGDIHAFLGRAVGVGNVQDCGMVSEHGGLQLLELSNRYFTPRSASVSGADEVPLSSDIDPLGYLAQAAASANMYHGTENSVDYFIRDGKDDNYSYNSATPIIFSVGDIVEVQASFVIFPLRGGKFKSAMVLRGLTLMDGSFTQACMKIRLMKTAGVSKPFLKRKSAYQEEGLSVASAKMVRMEIDETGRTRCRLTDADQAEPEHKNDGHNLD